ncbi:armadillo-type protein [Catenaria anguillulae PL171]|uniref:Armadillo-type protein n=1 Tax=Catenaria anguillulae PL171 TaxID=765915 RepID=A0A1Y2HAQ6_9FUNG|nr:armadillo-type protein [Catenaria anguillulae PL171]
MAPPTATATAAGAPVTTQQPQAASHVQLATTPTDKTSDPVTLHVTDAGSLLLLLKSTDASLAATVVDALARYAHESKAHRAYLLEHGLLAELVALLKGKAVAESLALKRTVIACLAAVTEAGEGGTGVVGERGEVVAHLVSLLLGIIAGEAEAVEVLDEACTAIAHVAREYTVKQTIRAQNGIKPLVALASSADPDVRRSALQALYVLMEDFACRSTARTLGVLTSIVDGCGSDYPEIQDLALAALIRCAQDGATRIELRKHLVVKRLTDLLCTPSTTPSVIPVILTSLALCIQDRVLSVGMAKDPQAMEALNKLLGKEDPKVKRAALDVIRVLGNDAENQTAIRDSGCFMGVVACLTHAEAGVVGAAAGAVHSLAAHDSNEQETLKSNLFETLLQRLPESDVRDSVLLGLASCMTLAKLRTLIRLHPTALTDIIKHLAAPATESVVSAAMFVANCADDEACRLELVKLDVIPALLGRVSGENVEVLQALVRVLQEPGARLAFRAAKGPEVVTPLLDLAKYKENVVSAACLVVSAASNSDFCQAGAPARLLAILPTLAHANPALCKLLDHHLSCRYWFKGALESHHSTATGTLTSLVPTGPAPPPCVPFYDLGTIHRPSTSSTAPPLSFPTLESLQSAPLDTRPPVLLIHPSDPILTSILTSLLSQLTPTTSPTTTLKLIAQSILTHWGPWHDAADDTYLRLAQAKCTKGSNVLNVSELPCATLAHRALICKAICDRLPVECASAVAAHAASVAAAAAAKMPAPAGSGGLTRSRPSSAAGVTNANAATSVHLPTLGSGIVAMTAAAPSVPSVFPCVSLVRGEYGRVWNEVVVVEDGVEVKGIVDLMSANADEAGRVVPLGSPAAVRYVRL